ncbi:hypothetical protein [Nocardia sp. NPDC051832]|uniref:hypothetical protein n=1 Tax=Nocardia sp. NPDC051832 TaxID=3155673 RepID=UPI00343DD324
MAIVSGICSKFHRMKEGSTMIGNGNGQDSVPQRLQAVENRVDALEEVLKRLVIRDNEFVTQSNGHLTKMREDLTGLRNDVGIVDGRSLVSRLIFNDEGIKRLAIGQEDLRQTLRSVKASQAAMSEKLDALTFDMGALKTELVRDMGELKRDMGTLAEGMAEVLRILEERGHTN